MIERQQLPQTWPTPPFHIVLMEPEIPGNTGNIARLCAATATALHLVDPLGFRIDDASVKRAGLDYWDAVDLRRHASVHEYMDEYASTRKFLLSTRATTSYCDVTFKPGDHFVFGSESTGLPQTLVDEHAPHVIGIPILLDHVRSLNLANSAAIVLYEALRQANL